MTEFSLDGDWQLDYLFETHHQVPFIVEEPAPAPAQCLQTPALPSTHEHLHQPVPSSTLAPHETSVSLQAHSLNHQYSLPKGKCPRENRNKAEKQRRDKYRQSILKLETLLPPVADATRKLDRTGILRMTAHYLRTHHIFGDSIGLSMQFKQSSISKVMSLLNGFLITTTYKGIIVVASQNMHEYLGYTKMNLHGQNILSIVHPDDHHMLMEQFMPRSEYLGPNGELLVPDTPDGNTIVQKALASEKRRFAVRFKKLSQRSNSTYVTCMVEGNLRKSDGAHSKRRYCQTRRARARGKPLVPSGNDVVFIGVVRPLSDTFMAEKQMESYRMDYRTRHSIDGQIIQVEQRISLVTGYMTHEVNGVNAMNFMHRDDVRWVVAALRDMYDHNNLRGESCYRLMTKSGEFIYMRTQGILDVDEQSRAVRSFVCINTQVEEEEGRQLISTMKQRLLDTAQQNRLLHESVTEGGTRFLVEDPKKLKTVIFNLVSNLPSPQADPCPGRDKIGGSLPLAIIPPKRDQIVGAIEKIYSVIKMFPNNKVATMESNKEADTDEPIPSEVAPPTTSGVLPHDAASRRRAFALQGWDRLPFELQLRFKPDLEEELNAQLLNVSMETQGPTESSVSTLPAHLTNDLSLTDLNNEDSLEKNDQMKASCSMLFSEDLLNTSLNFITTHASTDVEEIEPKIIRPADEEINSDDSDSAPVLRVSEDWDLYKLNDDDVVE